MKDEATAEQLALARRIVTDQMRANDDRLWEVEAVLAGRFDEWTAVQAALAAIIETTELAAKHAEGLPKYVHAADAAWDFRNGYHLKGTDQ